MPFHVEECTDADMARFFELVSEAFGREHIYIEAVFPHHETPAGRAAGAERMLGFKQGDPDATFLKVVDEASGAFIAAAKWNIYKGVVPPEVDVDGDYWESAEEKEFAQSLFRGYLMPRRRAIRETGGALVSLDILVVDPKWQNRGAGRMLTRWGTKIADGMGVKTVVEATEYGKGLYKSEGFEILEDYEVPVPEKFKDRQTQQFKWMERPIQSKA